MQTQLKLLSQKAIKPIGIRGSTRSLDFFEISDDSDDGSDDRDDHSESVGYASADESFDEDSRQKKDEGRDQRKHLPKFGDQYICHHEIATLKMLHKLHKKRQTTRRDDVAQGINERLQDLEKLWTENLPSNADRPSTLRSLAVMVIGRDDGEIADVFPGKQPTITLRRSQLTATFDRASKWTPDILPGDQLITMATLFATGHKDAQEVAKHCLTGIEFARQCETEVARVCKQFGINRDSKPDSLLEQLDMAKKELADARKEAAATSAVYGKLKRAIHDAKPPPPNTDAKPTPPKPTIASDDDEADGSEDADE